MDLAELGLKLIVDLVEGAAEIGELSASLVGDKELGHAVPVDVLRRLEGKIHHPLPGSAHFRLIR